MGVPADSDGSGRAAIGDDAPLALLARGLGDQKSKSTGSTVPRADKVMNAIIKKARGKAEGEELFARLRSSHTYTAVASELGLNATVPPTASDLDDAYRRCCLYWNKGDDRDVEQMVRKVMEISDNIADADKQFRAWSMRIHDPKPGKKPLTSDLIGKARQICHNYWAKITPGNVKLIQENVAGKCTDWPSAEKKFEWLWKKGQWQADFKAVVVSGRTFTVEDLQQAERQCRKRFGLPGTIDKRTPGTLKIGQAPPAAKQHPPTGAAPAATPPIAEGAAAPAKAATAPAPRSDTPPLASEAAEAATGEAALSNEDYLVQQMLKKCNSMEAAAKFFMWLRSESGRSIKKRTFSKEDVDMAEKRCKKHWDENKKDSSSSSSSSSTSSGEGDGGEDEDFEEAEEADEPEDKVEQIVKHLMGRFKSKDKAEKYIDKMREDGGGKYSLGFKLSEEESTEIYLTVTAKFEEKEAAKLEKQKQKEAAKKAKKAKKINDQTKPVDEALQGADYIIAYLKQRYSSFSKAEKMLDQLQETAGQMSPLGRVFEETAITEAWLRAQTELEEANADEDAAGDDADAEAEARRILRAERKRARELAEGVEITRKQSVEANLLSASGDPEANSDFIVREILRKYSTKDKADRMVDQLFGTLGQENPIGKKSGRVFTEQEVTEAWLRINQYFDELAEQSSEDDEDSSSSVDLGLKRRASKEKKPKDKKGRKKKGLRRGRSLVDEELEGALFSDDDDLSGEEQLDEEEEGLGAEFLADLGVGEDDEPPVLDDDYPEQTWKDIAPEVVPGLEGFNGRATLVMQKSGIGASRLQKTFDTDAACPPLQPHQEAVGFLLHPKSPVSRLLVDHPTGSGKTREMIKVLDNYFYDPRPKVPIFPKDPVCRNFYAELLRWPSRYRDYFCCEKPADAAIASGRPDWKEVRVYMWDLSGLLESEVRRLVYSIREVLEMKGMFWMGKVRRSYRVAFNKKNPGESMPFAPLRALGYTSAGGSFSSISEANGRPMSSLMKIGYETGSGNVYCNKVVLMDEAHNLVRSQTQYEDQLNRLKSLLFRAKNLVLAGFTGTPILNEPSEGRQLLDVIKGEGALDADDGFLSSFPFRPQPLFPMSLPRGIPDAVLTLQRRRALVQKVEITGETLKVYDWKKRIGLPARRLRAYCNVCTWHGSFHEGKQGTKVKILTFPEDHCPKFLAIAKAVCSSPEKAIVLTARQNGYIVMLELMRFLAAKNDPPFGVATMEELSEFNHVSNLRGEVFRVLVADAAQCSEGVSFLSVRRTFLSDVPVSPSAFIQQCGRAIRMYGHRGLPEEEQVVNNQLYVSTFPKWMRSSSLACWALRAQKRYNSGKEVEKRARQLTARFMRAGIRTLEDLKNKIDAHGRAKTEAIEKAQTEGTPMPRGKEGQLTAEDVISFLEQNGLWEEAKLLRQADKKEKDKQEKIEVSRMESQDSLNRLDSTLSMEDSMMNMETQDMDVDMETGKDDDLDGDGGLGDEMDLAGALGAAFDKAGINGSADAKVADEKAEKQSAQNGTHPLAPADSKDADAKAVAADGTKAAGGGEASAATAAAAPVRTASSSKLLTSGAEAEAALDEALAAAEEACKQMAAPAPAPGAEGQQVDQNAATAWRMKLEEVLLRTCSALAVVNAMKTAVHPDFKIQEGSVRELSPEQVKALRDELSRLRKVYVLNKMIGILKDARSRIDKLERAALMASVRARSLASSTGASVAMPQIKPEAFMPAHVLAAITLQGATPAAVATPAPAVEAAATPEAAAADAAPAEAAAEAAAQPASEGAEPAVANSAQPTEVTEGAEGVPAPKTETPPPGDSGMTSEEKEAEENAWRDLVADGLKEVQREEILSAALKVVAPDAFKDTESMRALEPRQVLRLHDELMRLKAQYEQAPPRPRALVRAMQALFAVGSVEDPSLSISTDTADELALKELTERTEEFAPALAGMRSMAVDSEVFAHLADKFMEDDPVASSESEASDLEKELGDKEPAPVVLPAGWRMEWVKRKSREAREFLDPAGNRYRSVREVRIALATWEARERAIAAAAAAAEAAGPPAKRTRLRGKMQSAAYDQGENAGEAFEAGVLEDLFAQELDAFTAATAGGSSSSTSAPPKSSPAAKPAASKPAPAATKPAPAPAAKAVAGKAAAPKKAPARTASQSSVKEAPSTKDTAMPAEEPTGPLEPAVGGRVKLHSLMAKPELNGKVGRIHAFLEEAGRWEVHLDGGGKVNALPKNFDVLREDKKPVATKRAAPTAEADGATARAKAKGKAAPTQPASTGRGRGRGRGRGAAAATASAVPGADLGSESD
eukprot:TRINITY_DN5837_c1_g2_i1.p1 TRINITY_DN5837_c1_g2~~TRINITY_DN5837_c1_g2_i1.p1  ORF type:complete len:2305 (-),score=805.31 TRINITY_DN5837_c1_g2_i1:211-7125(-)